MTSTSTFSKSEQEAINKAVKDSQDKARQAEIDAATRNAILDAQRKQPGYTGY